jgi:hypothetical protein
MDCPLCLWALPPPHCHGTLVFDGEIYRCDLRGPACRDIHPLEREPRHIAERPPSAATARTVAAAPVDAAIPTR